MFDDIISESSERFLKVKLYLISIRSLLPAPPIAPTEFHNTLKGLFFVYIYGSFEWSVTSTIRRTISELNSTGKCIDQVKPDLLSLALHSELDSLYGAGKNTKWQKRWSIVDRLVENNSIFIQDSLFPTNGENLRKAQLESIFKTFGNGRAIFPRDVTQGYLEEVVRFRNFIAHGDKIPSEIGRSYTIDQLLERHSCIDELASSIIDCFSNYITNEEYLSANA